MITKVYYQMHTHPNFTHIKKEYRSGTGQPPILPPGSSRYTSIQYIYPYKRITKKFFGLQSKEQIIFFLRDCTSEYSQEWYYYPSCHRVESIRLQGILEDNHRKCYADHRVYNNNTKIEAIVLKEV